MTWSMTFHTFFHSFMMMISLETLNCVNIRICALFKFYLFIYFLFFYVLKGRQRWYDHIYCYYFSCMWKNTGRPVTQSMWLFATHFLHQHKWCWFNPFAMLNKNYLNFMNYVYYIIIFYLSYNNIHFFETNI